MLLRGRLVVLATLVPALFLSGCTGDPNDPKTWAKKLDNPRERDTWSGADGSYVLDDSREVAVVLRL